MGIGILKMRVQRMDYQKLWMYGKHLWEFNILQAYLKVYIFKKNSLVDIASPRNHGLLMKISMPGLKYFPINHQSKRPQSPPKQYN